MKVEKTALELQLEIMRMLTAKIDDISEEKNKLYESDFDDDYFKKMTLLEGKDRMRTEIFEIVANMSVFKEEE